MQRQLPLDFEFNNEMTFSSFVAGNNEQVVDALKKLAFESSDSYLYLWGGSGAGKSHLLQAVCQSVALQKKLVALIPLSLHQQLSPEITDGLEQLPLVCIDDIGSIAGQPQWEEALFHLFNRVRDSGSHLLISGDLPPAQQSLQLNDLRSRLGWGLVLQLQPINDKQKILALQKRAHIRGMELNDELGQFLLSRYSRDMASLMKLLDTLDEASLSEQRRLTIPFVRQCLQ
jgi:DnaA family protein